MNIAGELKDWHLITMTGTIPFDGALNGAWFCFAKRIFNHIVSRTKSFQTVISTPTTFLDATYFLSRGSPIPITVPLPPLTYEPADPLYPSFNELLSALSRVYIPIPTTVPLQMSIEKYTHMFESIFGIWLNYGLEIPIGKQLGGADITSPSNYITDYIFDPMFIHNASFPSIVELPIGYATTGVALPYAYSSVYNIQAVNPLRPFYGQTSKFIWNPATIKGIASACASEIISVGITLTLQNALSVTMGIFEKYVVSALNTIVPTVTPTSTPVYGLPSNPSAPMAVTHTINWSL